MYVHKPLFTGEIVFAQAGSTMLVMARKIHYRLIEVTKRYWLNLVIIEKYYCKSTVSFSQHNILFVDTMEYFSAEFKV